MQSLKKSIASRQSELRNHRFFDRLRHTESREPLARMARALTWWPMVFQDVLRLNAERVQGTGLEAFAEFHRDEDSGHERWFLDDLRELTVDAPPIDELFGGDFEPIRDACYGLLAEVHRDQSPRERIALLLALEPTGHVFFEEVTVAVERLCPELPLRYFARFHLGVEKDHDLFTESTDAELDRLVLGEDERARAEAMVNRVFDRFESVFDYLAVRAFAANPMGQVVSFGGTGGESALDA